MLLVDASSTSPLLKSSRLLCIIGSGVHSCAPLTERIAQVPTAPHPTTSLPSSVSRGAHSSVYHNRLMAQTQRKRALNPSQKGDRTSSGGGTDHTMQLEPILRKSRSPDPSNSRTATSTAPNNTGITTVQSVVCACHGTTKLRAAPLQAGLAISQLLRRHTGTTQTPGFSHGGVQVLLGIDIPEVVKRLLKKGGTLLQLISASTASLIVWHLDSFGWPAWRACYLLQSVQGRAKRHAIGLYYRHEGYNKQRGQSSYEHNMDGVQWPG